MKLEYSVVVKAPMEMVFAYLTEPEYIKQWAKGVESVEFLDGGESEPAVGAKFVQKIREGGKLTEYRGEVVAYEKPRLNAVRLTHPMFSMENEYRLQETEGGTRVEYVCRTVFSSGVAKVMGFFFGWLTKKIARDHMQRLQELAVRESAVKV